MQTSKIGSHDLHIVKWAERGKENEPNRWEDGKREGRISVIFTTDLLPSLVTDTQTHNCFLSTLRGRYADPRGGGIVAPDPDTSNMIPVPCIRSPDCGWSF